jgi:hypothetical protein
MRLGEGDKTLHSGPPLPAWITSLVLHLLLVVALGWIFRNTPRGAAVEPVRSGGIVLARATDEGDVYEGPEEKAAPESTPEQGSEDLLAEALPTIDDVGLNPSEALPVSASVVGPQMLQNDGAPGAAQLTTGASGQPRSIPGGTAKVRVFGVEGEGSKFVYVFDRSASMVGSKLSAAKRELLASLQSLGSTHQFQIVFFNSEQWVFDLSGGQNRIPFADERTKNLAERFVNQVFADGGTDRYAALMTAIRMRPDVIFFLSDADNPMTAAELNRIRQNNGGVAAIHTIEFGNNRRSAEENSLQRLSRQNRGTYVLVDTWRLP